MAFRHEAVNQGLVLALSHCLWSLSIWPAVWSQLFVLWFLLFMCSTTPAFILWLPGHLPPVFQVSCLAESVLGLSSCILLVWAPACACLMCDPCTGCPLPETLWYKQRSDPSLGVRCRGRLHSDTPSCWEALMLTTCLWSICLSTKTIIVSSSSSRLFSKWRPVQLPGHMIGSATSKQTRNLKPWWGFSTGNCGCLHFAQAKSVPVCEAKYTTAPLSGLDMQIVLGERKCSLWREHRNVRPPFHVCQPQKAGVYFASPKISTKFSHEKPMPISLH